MNPTLTILYIASLSHYRNIKDNPAWRKRRAPRPRSRRRCCPEWVHAVRLSTLVVLCSIVKAFERYQTWRKELCSKVADVGHSTCNPKERVAVSKPGKRGRAYTCSACGREKTVSFFRQHPCLKKSISYMKWANVARPTKRWQKSYQKSQRDCNERVRVKRAAAIAIGLKFVPGKGVLNRKRS